MTEHRNATDHALDLFLYAPLGMLSEAAARVPEMAERGRVQVGNAKVLGQFAVQFGRQRAESRISRVPSDARALLATWGLVAPEVTATPAPTVGASSKPTPASSTHPEPASPVASPDPATLAIPDYDSLAASQVVARLVGLRAAELEAVRLYESTHRARKTILGRIAQLSAK